VQVGLLALECSGTWQEGASEHTAAGVQVIFPDIA
jgi:hypothetical protein